jgi:6-phosphofructokinase
LRNAAIAHGGGPTAVLNASLAGLIHGCRGSMNALYGARFGLPGIVEREMPDLLQTSADSIDAIALAPGSAIGSSRVRLTDDLFERIVDRLKRRDIRTVFYTGGNGSMRTALDLLRYSRSVAYELQVIGIPKTIDNDLPVTHHTPGYASTAYFFACAARDAGIDNESLPSPLCILETLGRNAGWIVAATALSNAAHLIYFPERPLSADRIAADVESVYRKHGRAVIAVCEGQRDERGQPFGADVDRPDSPVHNLASNLGHAMARMLTAKLGLRARSEKPGLIGRSCGLFARERDRNEAFACGAAAATAALRDETGVMVALDSEGGTFLTPLEEVAGKERLFPQEWIAENGNGVTGEFRAWAEPLVGPVPAWPVLP